MLWLKIQNLLSFVQVKTTRLNNDDFLQNEKFEIKNAGVQNQQLKKRCRDANTLSDFWKNAYKIVTLLI